MPEDARREAGHQLDLLQKGKDLTDWKPMPVVGTGAIEVRLHTGTEHRLFVIAKFEEAVYVLHAFEKKSQRTPKHDIDIATKRYNDLIAERRSDEEAQRRTEGLKRP